MIGIKKKTQNNIQIPQIVLKLTDPNQTTLESETNVKY